MSTRKALTVLGMHRSGTSALTRTLSIYGATLPQDIIGAASDNPSGFWEPQSTVELNDRILDELAMHWSDPSPIAIDNMRPERVAKFIDEAAGLLRQSYGDEQIIVFKDPRTSILIPIWSAAFAQANWLPYYIFIIRNPLQVARSLEARDAMMVPEHGLLLWMNYMLQAERNTRGQPRVFITFDSLLRDHSKVIQCIEKRLSIRLPRHTEAAMEEAQTFLEKALRHHLQSDEDLEQTGAWPPILDTYRWFKSAAVLSEEPAEQGLEIAWSKLIDVQQATGSILRHSRNQLERARSMLRAG